MEQERISSRRKFFFPALTFFALIELLAQTSFGSSRKDSFTVVIDPGHGGSDLGTVHAESGKSIAEKDVTLQLAQTTAAYLRRRGIRVILTRTQDLEISLPERTAIANRARAHVFISIHMNSAPEGTHGGGAEGVETYILNNTTDASSRRLARLENAGLSTTLDDSQNTTDVALILKDLRLDANLGKSKQLACAIQNRLVSATTQGFKNRPIRIRERDRGVKQALFYVLLGADMPSTLVEIGFLSHPEDRKAVVSPRGRGAIGKAIADAVLEYRDSGGEKSLSLGRCKVN